MKSKCYEKPMMVVLPAGFFEDGGTLRDLPNGLKELEFGEGLERYRQIYPSGSAIFSKESLQNPNSWEPMEIIPPLENEA